MEGRINDDESIFADVTFDPGGKLHAGASADRCLVSRSGLCLRGCGFGSVASGLRGWRFAIVDIYAGKGIIGVGNFIFSLCCMLIIHLDLRKVVNLDADVSVDGL